jgi:hypothetical protein
MAREHRRELVLFPKDGGTSPVAAPVSGMVSIAFGSLPIRNDRPGQGGHHAKSQEIELDRF